MAIYVGLELLKEENAKKFFTFFGSDGTTYGVLSVEVDSLEFELVESRSKGGQSTAFPRACRALQKAAKKGSIPDRLCYAA